ncbi:VWA domain-containing protein [Nocardia sp. NPDC005978]|uniref:vWA domain-containing protein n=1 Tax=Nocardia sp. NPDC005978 TaxID=3156725 RepID=UPI0033B1CB18
MAATLTKGQNAPLEAAGVAISVRSAAAVDVSALLVTANGKVRSDADFVFFNQPSGPGVDFVPGSPASLWVSPAAVPAEIDQVRVVLTLDDPAATFGRFAPPVVGVRDSSGNTLCEYTVEGLDTESVVIALEVYRRAEAWKVRAVGQGYAGGFAALVTDHGVSVDDSPEPVAAAAPAAVTATSAASATSATASVAPVSAALPPGTPPPASDQLEIRSAPGESALPPEQRQRLDLRKREVAKVLLTKRATGVRARVVLVIDKTGSMRQLYNQKVVHRVVERMIPIAIQLDDDGLLEPYLYARDFLKLPSIAVDQAHSWTEKYLHLSGTREGLDYDFIGLGNVEMPIMREIMRTLKPGGPPTLVLFFTDGGFSKKREIADLMREAANLPAFWQFIGLGKANFGVLNTLDELDGRTVDNAGFFPALNIDELDDPALYTSLLGEFPDWLRAARAAGITR